MRILFGEFVLDLDQRRLFAGAREIRLARKTFDLLKLLLENRPRAMTKNELMAGLWPDTFVAENNLATLVADLRSTLRDDPHEPRFIRTVYAYGYAFTGDAVDDRPGRSIGKPCSGWSLIHDSREIALGAGENILGRAGSDVVVLDSPAVSRRHARLTIAGDQAVVEDLGSKNGTFVGPDPIHAPRAVQDGDRLRLGPVVVIVRSRRRLFSTETVCQT